MPASTAHYGQAMALTAAMIFGWTSILFTIASVRLGVTAVNLLRLPGGALCLALAHLAVTGRPWPAGLAWPDQAWLAASGVLGLAVGDSALFRSFLLIGPRRGITVMALAPVFTVLTAWWLLDERLGPWSLVGIVAVIAGVILAARGRGGGPGTDGDAGPFAVRNGLLLALVAAAGQGLGSVFAKLGLAAGPGAHPADPTGGVSPLGGTLVRMTWAAAAYWVVVAPRLDPRRLAGRLADRRGLLVLSAAVLLGPFLSVWISLVAIKHGQTGVVQALLGTVPIFVILPAWIVYRDRPSPAGLAGIALAVAGGILLFVR